MNKPLTVMIIDNETWYSENDWRILVAQKLELEERLCRIQSELEYEVTYRGGETSIGETIAKIIEGEK